MNHQRFPYALISMALLLAETQAIVHKKNSLLCLTGKWVKMCNIGPQTDGGLNSLKRCKICSDSRKKIQFNVITAATQILVDYIRVDWLRHIG